MVPREYTNNACAKFGGDNEEYYGFFSEMAYVLP